MLPDPRRRILQPSVAGWRHPGRGEAPDVPRGRSPRLACSAHRTGRAGRAARSLEPGQGVSGVDGRRGVDGPEQRSLWERCVTRGLPCRPDFYSNNVLILQTPDNMVILMEMTQEPRLIPLDGRQHPHLAVGQSLGDSRGRWEDDTLVVDTTNFLGQNQLRGSGEGLHLVERFTRVAGDTILHERNERTLEDAATWTAPGPRGSDDAQRRSVRVRMSRRQRRHG